jgi:hypothetical protein
MQLISLDDFLEEHSFAGIAKKTNITVGIVEKIFNRDFRSLGRTQVLGAMAIIEREFGVDMSSLRDECKAYFNDHLSKDHGVVVGRPVLRRYALLSKIIVITLLGLTVYGAWYFFGDYYAQKNTPIDPVIKESFDDTVLHDNNAAALEPERNRSVVSAPIPAVEVQTSQVNVSEANHSLAATDDQLFVLKETIVSQDANTAQQPKEILQDAAADDETNVTETVPPVIRETITLLPQNTMKFVLIDMESGQKEPHMTKRKFDIDLKQHGWLFSTEDENFTFIDNSQIMEFGGEGKFFFKLDGDGVQVLSEEAFSARQLQNEAKRN